MNTTDVTEIAIALLDGELKCLESLAAHLPRQDGSALIGVNSATAWQWLQRGNLKLPSVSIDGKKFYYVAQADQRKVDWNLQVKFVKRKKRGRISAHDLLFGELA